MTVASQTTKVTTGAGNGSTTVFSFSPIVIFETDELEVKLITLATGAETLLSLGTSTANYSVAATTTFPGTGSITYPATLGTQMASTHKLSIKRVLTLEQTLDIENQGGYLPENQEQAFDKGVMLDLQQQEEIDRSLKAPQGISSSFNFEIPEGLELAANAGFGLVINDDSDGFDIKGITGPTSAFMVTMLNDATAREARTTLISGVKGADVASTAGIMTLGVDGDYFDITGTNSITGIATLGIGQEVTLHFDAAATLVHHATNLIMPAGASVVCAAGDEFTFIEYAAADWRCTSYALASGRPLVGGAGVKGADVASTAGVMTLPGDSATYYDITGTNSITGIATKGIGREVTLHFDAAAVLVHDATNFVLPGGSNITCAAGDEFTFVEYASADWRCVSYALASGKAIVVAVPTTVTITDNESTNEDNAIIFAAGGDIDGGDLGLESDGTLTYNPSTGKVTATGFVGALTGDASGSALTVTQAAQSAITSVGTITNFVVSSPDTSTDAVSVTNDGDSTCASFIQTTSNEICGIFKGGNDGATTLLSFQNSSGVEKGKITNNGGLALSGTFTQDKGADVASTAGVMTLGADGNYFDITGTNSITGIATLGVGTFVTLHFDAAATLVHHSTDLIMPGAANVVCAAGDEFTFVEFASADWRCVSYALASGKSIISGAGVKGSDVASTAGVMTLGAGSYFDITGTNSITGIATLGIGKEVTLHFDAAAVLVHDATNFVLPGGVNITCAANDEFTFVEYASADWRCVSYVRATGAALVGGGNTTTDGLYEHSFTIAGAYTIGTGNNALSAGPITIGSSGSVTIPATSTWIIA